MLSATQADDVTADGRCSQALWKSTQQVVLSVVVSEPSTVEDFQFPLHLSAVSKFPTASRTAL